MLLDFQTVDDDELRLHVETSVEAVEAFEKTKLFTEASERDQYLWNFHSHHEAVYARRTRSSSSSCSCFGTCASSGPCSTQCINQIVEARLSMSWRYKPDSLVDLRTGSTRDGLHVPLVARLARGPDRGPPVTADALPRARPADGPYYLKECSPKRF